MRVSKKPGRRWLWALVVLFGGPVLGGCVDDDPVGGNDALVEEEASVEPDAGLDAAVPDADAEPGDAAVDAEVVDASPNPYVVVLPPTGENDITAFSNADLLVTYSEYRDFVTVSDIFYYDITSQTEHQVTSRPGAESAPYVYNQEIFYTDYQLYDANAQNYQVELYHYDVVSGTDTRYTNQVSMKNVPEFNDEYILYLTSDGCATYTDNTLTLLHRQSGDSTVLADCWQDPETHSISERYAAWTARPAPGLSKGIFVHDLQTGDTFRVGESGLSGQYFPHTDDDHVVWQDSRDGRREVYMYTFSTGLEECLTPDGWEQGWPHLRNGIASWCDYSFSQQWGHNGDCDIYVHEIASGIGRRVTTHSALWRPRFVDSGWILYARRVNGNQYKLFVHDLVGDGILSGDGHVLP